MEKIVSFFKSFITIFYFKFYLRAGRTFLVGSKLESI
jgi:hypothetical protein